MRLRAYPLMLLLALVSVAAPQEGAVTHLDRGNALLDQGDLDGAIAEYREALRLKPDYANVHNNLGVALKGKGGLDGAIAEYREALRLKPDYADAHMNLGVAQGER